MFFTISTGTAPNNSDGIINIKIILRTLLNAPPWYKDGVKKLKNKPIDMFSPSIK